MTENLLALQKVTLDADQRLLLAQLGNKVEAISKKRSNEQDWQNVQTKINDLLNKNSTLAGHYQQFSAQLQTWTDEELWAWLSPSQEKINALLPQPPVTLGGHKSAKPISPLGEKETSNVAERVKESDRLKEVVNKAVTAISRTENPSEASKSLFARFLDAIIKRS